MRKSIISFNNKSNQSGFALLIVIALILLMSMISVVSYRHLLLEYLNTQQFINREIVFQETEKRLHECIEAVSFESLATSNYQCCYIEKSNASKTIANFRISAHLIYMNEAENHLAKSTLAQSRQQAIVQLTINPKTSEIKSRKLISWREIIDHQWDEALDQSTNKPWQHLKPCILNLETTI